MKLKAHDCQALIDKMIQRIKQWSSRNLSFVDRSQLVHSVLMSIHVYWGQIFVLSKVVIHVATSVCRCFFMDWDTQ